MKHLLIFVLALTVLSESAFAGDFHRFWRGVRRPDLSAENFERELETRFMPATVTVGEGRGLNSYLVVIPPADRPAIIPDEIALVTYASEEAYRAIRATPEGQAYSDMHWDVFARDISRSAVPELFALAPGAALEVDKAYDMFGASIDWQAGATYAFIGLRRPEISSADFLTRLAAHLPAARDALRPFGLDGYLAIATAEYEIAFMHFPSKDDAARAFASSTGGAVATEAGQLMTMVMFAEAKMFQGDVNNGELVVVPVRR